MSPLRCSFLWPEEADSLVVCRCRSRCHHCCHRLPQGPKPDRCSRFACWRLKSITGGFVWRRSSGHIGFTPKVSVIEIPHHFKRAPRSFPRRFCAVAHRSRYHLLDSGSAVINSEVFGSSSRSLCSRECVEIRLVRRRACARAIHVISYVVFKYLVCIEIVTVRLVVNAPLSFSSLVPTRTVPARVQSCCISRGAVKIPSLRSPPSSPSLSP